MKVQRQEPHFSESPDSHATLQIIRSFQDWAGSIASTNVTNMEWFFESLAQVVARDLELPLITVWDNNEFGKCLVLLASVPKRTADLPHTIPVDGTLTGEAVKQIKVTPSKVRNRVLVSEGITEMLTIPVPSHLPSQTVALAINFYFKSDVGEAIPLSHEDLNRLLSRFVTVLQNQIYKRDSEIANRIRSIAGVAKGITSVFDGISSHLQELTRCSYAALYIWNDFNKELNLEGFFLLGKESWLATDLHRFKQEKSNLFLDELKIRCIGRLEPFVFTQKRRLQIAITDENTLTIQCPYIAVPIVSSQGKSIGVLVCGDPVEVERLAPSFSSFDLHALKTFSEALSPSIERVLISRQEGRLLTIVKAVSDSMVRSYDLSKNLQKAIETIVDTLHSEMGSLYLRGENSDTLKMVAASGSNQKLIGTANYEIGYGITGAIGEGKIIHFKSREELTAHPKFKGKYDKTIWGDRPDQRETFLGVPIVINGRVRGVWKVSNVIQSRSHPDPYYTDEDIQIAKVVSSFLAYAIQNHEQEEKRLKQFTSLANHSIEIQKAANEEEAILSIMVALADVDIDGTLLSLYNAQTGKIVGNQILGDTWKEPASQYACHINDNEIRANVLRENKESIEIIGQKDHGGTRGVGRSKQFVLPLRLEDELIGTLQFDIEAKKLNDRRIRILKAFASHLSIAISRLRSIRETFDLTNRIMVTSRFIVAHTVSAMAVHSVHHKIIDIRKQLRDDLSKREVKENRFLLDTLKSWQGILDGLERDLNAILTIVRAPHDETSTRARDIHPEIQATISTWYNYIRGHKCRIEAPQLEAENSFCKISPQSFREILAVLLVNSIQAHARNIEIRTYNSKDVPVLKNDLMKKDLIRSAFCLECSDDGHGLATKDIEKIFGANYTTKPPDMGSGLGLFVARALAREAEGDLEVKETRQTKGVTFQLILPLSEDHIDG